VLRGAQLGKAAPRTPGLTPPPPPPPSRPRSRHAFPSSMPLAGVLVGPSAVTFDTRRPRSPRDQLGRPAEALWTALSAVAVDLLAVGVNAWPWPGRRADSRFFGDYGVSHMRYPRWRTRVRYPALGTPRARNRRGPAVRSFGFPARSITLAGPIMPGGRSRKSSPAGIARAPDGQGGPGPAPFAWEKQHPLSSLRRTLSPGVRHLGKIACVCWLPAGHRQASVKLRDRFGLSTYSRPKWPRRAQRVSSVTVVVIDLSVTPNNRAQLFRDYLQPNRPRAVSYPQISRRSAALAGVSPLPRKPRLDSPIHR